MPTETINSRTVLGRRSFIASEPCESTWQSYVGAGSHMPSQRKHGCPHNGKQENRHSKSECDDTHPALLELSRGTSEEKHCGKQNSVREVLAGNAAGVARCLQAARSLRVSLGGLARSPHFVEFRHKRMRIGVWIFKRSFGQPRVVS